MLEISYGVHVRFLKRLVSSGSNSSGPLMQHDHGRSLIVHAGDDQDRLAGNFCVTWVYIPQNPFRIRRI
jgi:hypothetical protein